MTLRTHSIRRRAGGLGLVAALALTGAACGNEDTGSDSSSASSDGADSQETLEDEGQASEKTDLMQDVYEAAMEAGTAHVVMETTGAAAMTSEGDISYDKEAPSMSMTTKSAQGGDMEMRLVDGMLYMQIPNMTPPGKFVEIDPTDKSNPMAQSYGGMTNQMDPLASVKSLEKAITKVKKVGEEKVDGEDTDHYQLTVDTATMLKQAGGQAPQEQSGIPETLTYDLWLDDDDLMRKMSMDVAGTKLDMQLSKWGEPVDIEKPAAGDIVKQPGT